MPKYGQKSYILIWFSTKIWYCYFSFGKVLEISRNLPWFWSQILECQFLDMNKVVAKFYWHALALVWQKLKANQSGSSFFPRPAIGLGPGWGFGLTRKNVEFVVESGVSNYEWTGHAALKTSVFFIFIFFENIFYKNIFSISQFTVLYPCRPAGGRQGLIYKLKKIICAEAFGGSLPPPCRHATGR